MNITTPSFTLVPAYADQWRDPPHENTLLQNLARFFLSSECADLTIHCNNHQFRAHRVFLKAQTGWFEAALTQPYNQQQQNHIHLHHAGGTTDDHVALWGFLKFCYTGDIDVGGTIPDYQRPYLDSDVGDPVLYYARVYFLADYFDAPNIFEHCVSRITAALNELRFPRTIADDRFATVDIPNLIREVYSHLGHKETDPLRDVLVRAVRRNWDEVNRDPNFGAVFEDYPVFREDWEKYAAKYGRLTGRFASDTWEDSE